MEAIARSRFVRYAPRKVNQVLTLIRNKKYPQALSILSVCPKRASRLVKKVLAAARANLGKNINEDKVKVAMAYCTQGPYLKRMRPGPQGRAMLYRRKTSHLTIMLRG
jgi:large subunit ribosomal protein L22